MHVSVVIPAKNESGTIEQCLDRLVPQLDPDDELLVLDNDSTDDTAAVAATYEAVTVIDAPDEEMQDTLHYRGNLDAVRQYGAELARNEIVVSTDADTLPPAGWIDRIKTHFENDHELDLVWGVPVDTNGVPLRNIESKFVNLFGAISGCNTAFRKSTFESLDKGYVGWPLYEDAAIVNRIARVGKVVHDRDLKMPTDMDRRRFQTLPIFVGSGAGLAAGTAIGGPVGAAVVGSGVGLAGTELFYEHAPSTRYHHDQVGLLMILGGTLLGGVPGMLSAGAGSGLIAHHFLTEGVSAFPTELRQNTDQVCQLPEDVTDETAITRLDCEPAGETTAKVTRILAAATGGGIAGLAAVSLLA